MGRITNKSGVSVKPIAHIVDKLSSAIAGVGNFANDGGATIGAQTPVSPRHFDKSLDIPGLGTTIAPEPPAGHSLGQAAFLGHA